MTPIMVEEYLRRLLLNTGRHWKKFNPPIPDSNARSIKNSAPNSLRQQFGFSTRSS